MSPSGFSGGRFGPRERMSEGGDAGGCLRTSDAEALESSPYGAGTFEEPLDERVVPPAAEEQEIREGEAIAHQVAVPERPEDRLLRNWWVLLAQKRRGGALPP